MIPGMTVRRVDSKPQVRAAPTPKKPDDLGERAPVAGDGFVPPTRAPVSLGAPAPTDVETLRRARARSVRDQRQGAMSATPAPSSATEATTDATEAAKAASRARADADFENLPTGATYQGEVLRLLEANANDPEYQAQLMGRIAASGLGALRMSEFFGGISMEYERDATEGARQTITTALKHALDRGTVSPEQLQDLEALSRGGHGNDGMPAMLEAAGVAPRASGPEAGIEAAGAASDAVRDVRAAQGELDEARSALAAQEAELAEILAAGEGVLSDAQKARLVANFREEHKDLYEAEARAAEALAQTLEQHQATLSTNAALDPSTASAYAEALTSLADSSQALKATELVATALAKGDPLVLALGGDAKVEELLGAAMQRATANGLGTSGDIDATIAQVSAALDKAVKGAGSVTKGVQQIRSAISALNSPPPDDIERMAKAAASAGPIGRAVGVLRMVQGAVKAGADIANGNYLGAIKNLAQAGGATAELVGGMLAVMAKAGSTAARTGATALARLTPGLAAIAGAVSGIENFTQFMESKNPGYLISVFGDVLTTLGGVVGSIPGGQPAQWLIGGAGSIISAVGGLVASLIDGNRLEERKKQALVAVGVPEKVADELIEHPELARTLADALGWTPEQIIEALSRPDGWAIIASRDDLAAVRAALGAGAPIDDVIAECKRRLEANMPEFGWPI